jgi:hypothetical protein
MVQGSRAEGSDDNQIGSVMNHANCERDSVVQVESRVHHGDSGVERE